MKKQEKILFVTQERKDAIGICDMYITQELKKLESTISFFSLIAKGTKKRDIIKNYIKNIWFLLQRAKSYATIFFSWENPYVIFLKLFFPQKKIILTVNHVEKYWWESIVGKLMLQSCSKFVVISEFTKNQLIDIGAKEKKIFVNYLWMSCNYFPEKIENYKPFPYILSVWTELPRKNIYMLLHAFKEITKKFPTIKLIKVGKAGTKEDEENTNTWIRKLKIQENIILKRNFITEEELRTLYTNAVCYVSVPTLEWFWMTIPEAMACWCPVVASSIPPFQEIIGNSQILVDPQNIHEIQAGIQKYISDSKLRENMSKEWIAIASRFNWKKTATGIQKILIN